MLLKTLGETGRFTRERFKKVDRLQMVFKQQMLVGRQVGWLAGWQDGLRLPKL